MLNPMPCPIYIIRHFEFRLCVPPGGGANLSAAATQECLNTHVLTIDEGTPEYLATNGHGTTRFDYQGLNPGVRCASTGGHTDTTARDWGGNWPRGSCCNGGGACSDPANNTDRWVIPRASGEPYVIHLKVPVGIACERCVLQWYYQTGNSVDTFPESFWNCADVKILAEGTTGHATGCSHPGALPESPTPPPVSSPTPLPAPTPTPPPAAPTTPPPSLANGPRCGTDWADATATCGTACLYPSDCPSGESCFAGVAQGPCSEPPPPPTYLPPPTPPPTSPPVSPTSPPPPTTTAPTPEAVDCPPAAWGCGWPATEEDPCCSRWGYSGSTSGYCLSPGLDSRALGECSCRTVNGAWQCGPVTPPPVIPANCTGDPAVDAVLSRANVPSIAQLHASDVYTWDGFCHALRALRDVGLGNYTGSSLIFYLGEGNTRTGESSSRNKALINVAGMLSQCMWESGGDAPFTACDENDYQGWPTSACSQRTDGTFYAELSSEISCAVDPAMQMTAETFATWTNGPLVCAPGTVTEGCCWWGRGAIQTTGPHNYAALQRDVINGMTGYTDINLCTNPEAMCQHDELKWVGALHYWTTIVQQSDCFHPTLAAYAEDMRSGAAIPSCYDFPRGVGGSINNGFWNTHAHGEAGRLRYFDAIVEAMRTAADSIDAESTVATTESTTVAPTGDTPLVGFFCPGCLGVNATAVLEEMHPAYSTVIVRSLELDIQGAASHSILLTQAQVTELQQTRTVLLEVAFPVLNCQADTQAAATATNLLLSSHGFDGVHVNVGTVLCEGADGGNCDFAELKACAESTAEFISANFASGQISIGATQASVRPTSSNTDTQVNHVALLLGQTALASIVDFVVIDVGSSTTAFNSTSTSNYLTSVSSGFSLLSAAPDRRDRQRRRALACYTDVATFGCVASPSVDPAFGAWCNAHCVSANGWHSTCARAGEAGGEGSACSCFCLQDTGTVTSTTPSPVASTTPAPMQECSFVNALTFTCSALGAGVQSWCDANCLNAGVSWHPACRRPTDPYEMDYDYYCDCSCNGAGPSPTPPPNPTSCYKHNDEHSCTPLIDLPGYQTWCDESCLNVVSWHPACRRHVDEERSSDFCQCSCDNAGPSPTPAPAEPRGTDTACCRPLRADYPRQWCLDSCQSGVSWHPACRQEGEESAGHHVCDCECTGTEPTTPAPTSAPVSTDPTLYGLTFSPTEAPVSSTPTSGSPTFSPVTLVPTTSSPTPSPGTPTISPGAKKLVGYYTNWAQYRPSGHQFYPENIDATLLTHICYAFAVLNPNFGVVPFEWNDIVDWNPSQGMYARFHTHVRSQNPDIKTLISLGGWTFNERPATKTIFTNMAETQTNRARFIRSAIAFARSHSFDGVDIDWEYPSHVGQGGRPQDKANFVLLLREFRAAINMDAEIAGTDPLLLTIAVGAAGPTVTNGYQIDQIHQELDWIGVMSYDLHGGWESATGMHTSMNGNDPISVLNGMQQWMDGGAPADKLVMGFATYGRGWTLTDAANNGIGAAAKGSGAPGAVTREPGFLASYEIQALIDRGGTAEYDNTTKCMYARSGDQWVGYDNEATFATKIQYLAERDFAGGMVWALDLDDFTNGYPLVTALKTGFDAIDTSPTTSEPTSAPNTGTPSLAPTPSPTPTPTLSPTPRPTLSPLSTMPTSLNATFSPTPAPTPAPTLVTSSPTPAPTPSPILAPTRSQGAAPCDDGSVGACKSQCSAMCRGRGSDVAVNQCWGTPRYIQCDCRDGSAHAFSGCECENSLCPAAPTGPSPPTEATHPTTTVTGGTRSIRKKLVGYYTNWAQYRPSGHQFYPENIDATLLTHICYAFAVLNPNFGVVPFEWNDIVDWNPSQGMYARFHTHVRSQNPDIKTLISLGGWTFNERPATKTIFTNMAETQTNRARFIRSAIAFARSHSFDGVDIDWEYPSHVGQGGRPQDKANFVLLLREFRAAINMDAEIAGTDPLLLTIAVGAAGPTVTNGYQIDQIHQELDWIGVMSYDLHGGWESATGMHTSMNGNDPISVLNGMQQWMDGGAPADKLVMGFATYGRGWTLTDAANNGIGAAAKGSGAPGAVTREPGFLASYEIQALIDRGGTAEYDNTTKCMYARSGDQWVGYDNEATFATKIQYLAERDFAGGMVWALDLDDFTNGYPLVSTIKAAMDRMPTPEPITTSSVDGGWTWSPTSPTAAPTAAPTATTSVFVWAPLNKVVPSFGVTGNGITLRRFAERLEVASMRVAGIGGVSIELDQQQAWSFAASFRPDLEWPPGGGPPTASAAPAITGRCSGCLAGLVGDCKRLSDSTCWAVNAIDGECPSDTVECANEVNTVAVKLGTDLSDPTLLADFRTSVVGLLCDAAEVKMFSGMAGCIRKQLTHENRAYDRHPAHSDQSVSRSELTVMVVGVAIDAKFDGAMITAGRRRRIYDMTPTTTVEFYAVLGQRVISAASFIDVLEAAETIAGANVSNVGTQAALHGPTVEFDCDALPNRNCSSMQAACDVWCRGPSQPGNCDLQVGESGSYPPGTTAHKCACLSNPAQTVCTFESTVQYVAWTVESPMLVFIVDHGDVLAFGDNSDDAVSVSKLRSKAAYETCDFTGAVSVTAQGATVLYTTNGPGDLFFAHPADCSNGLKIQVVVRDNEIVLPPTPSPSPSPTTFEPTPSPTSATSYCPTGYDDYGVRYNWGLGRITIVSTHDQCSARCTQYSAPQFSGGCKAYMTGMYFGMLFCRSYGGDVRTQPCALWAKPGDRGVGSGLIGSVHPRTNQENIGGNCCSNSTFVASA